MEQIRVWQIGPDGTEYYAAHSEEELRAWYVKAVGEKQAAEDFAEFWEVPASKMDEEFEFNDGGEIRKTTWRKLADEIAVSNCPTQISSGYL
jgi:hypothetical protein